MDIQNLKQKIKEGQITDEELSQLLESAALGKGNFIQNILKGFIDGYTTPNLWKLILESFLIFVVVAAVSILAYAGKMDTMISAVILSSVLGFLFGKIK